MNRTIKLYYKKLSQWYDPELVFTTLFAQKNCSFWLDSSLSNKENRFSYMGSSPEEIYSYSLKDSKMKIYKDTTSTYAAQDIFTFLDTQIKKKKIQINKVPFDFTGGYVGYFGYELKALTGGSKIHTSLYPDSLWFL